jgi:hypothetical protein
MIDKRTERYGKINERFDSLAHTLRKYYGMLEMESRVQVHRDIPLNPEVLDIDATSTIIGVPSGVIRKTMDEFNGFEN